MSQILELCIRLVASALIGAVIGFERELRGKGAGIRTHLLVAMGSCLFMLISIYGFGGTDRFDASRVAAGVVGGLGFLGGGIIMKNRHVVGLTTAAGIWVTGAIGMSLGCGMYLLAGLCAFLLMLCMEAMHFYTVKFGERQVNVTLSSDSQKVLEEMVKGLGKQVNQFSLSKKDGRIILDLSLLVKKKEYPLVLLNRLNSFPGVQLESLD